MIISLIAAVDSKNGIGLNGKMPWGHIKEDMEFFRKTTTGFTVIMGRCTFESLGNKPLPDRRNIVISSTPNLVYYSRYHNLFYEFSLEDAIIKLLREKEIFIIGGESIYKKAIYYADTIYLTHIDKDYNCDRFFPDVDENIFTKEELKNFEHDSVNVRICKYTKKL